MLRSPRSVGRRVLVLGDHDGATAYIYGAELTRAGWEVHGAGPRRWMLARATWCAGWHTVPTPEADLGAFVDAVAAVVAAVRPDLVVACRDAELVALSAHRAAIGAPVALPPHDAVVAVLDKLVLVGHAARHGFAVPATQPIDPAAGPPAGLVLPCVVKARLHLEDAPPLAVGRAPTPGWFAAERADSWPEAAARAAALAAQGARPIAQELLGAPMHSVVLVLDRAGGVVTAGEMRATVLRKGSIAVGVTVAPDPDVVRRLAGMFHELGAWGLLQVDFATRADGARCPIDVNPRPFASMRVFAAAGFPLGALAAAVALGDPVPARGTVPAGRRHGSFGAAVGASEGLTGGASAPWSPARFGAALAVLRATRPVPIFPDPRPVAWAALARTVRGIRAHRRPAGREAGS